MKKNQKLPEKKTGSRYFYTGAPVNGVGTTTDTDPTSTLTLTTTHVYKK